jgi:transposase
MPPMAATGRLEPAVIIAAQAPLGRVLQWSDSKIANGLIEEVNSLVQAAKAKARGYRSTRNLEAIIYLLAGKLDLRRPA